MSLITKGLKAISAAINPVTMADAEKVHDQLKGKYNIASNHPKKGGYPFCLLADPLFVEFRDMKTAQDLPKLPSLSGYIEARKTEARSLADVVVNLQARRAEVISGLAALKRGKSKALANLESAVAAGEQNLPALSEAVANAKNARANALGESIESGAPDSFSAGTYDAAIRKAGDALAAAQDTHGVVLKRLEDLRAELKGAEQDADAKTKALDSEIQAAQQDVAQQSIDTAAGLYVLTLAELPFQWLPDFDLQIHDASRVPFAAAGDRSVTWKQINRHNYFTKVLSPADWVNKVEESGLLDTELTPLEWKDGHPIRE